MHGEYKMPGGKLVVADLEVRDGRLSQVQMSGDFFLEPESALEWIDNALNGQPADSDEHTLAAHLKAALGERVAMYGISEAAIARAVQRALGHTQ